MICVAVFTVSSLLCGFAPSLGALIFFRVLQGVGGGGLAPVEQAILVDTFSPAKRAAAFALYSMAIVTAPAIGPPLGGWITDHWSWRWVFFINIPIGIVSLLLTSRLLLDPPEFTREVESARNGGRLKIDGWGIFSVAMAFACLEVVLDRGQTEDWFESNFIIFFFMVAMIALVFAIVWEWRHPDPVVEIRLLADRNFALANIFLLLVWIYAVWFYCADSANVAAVVRIYGNGCGIGVGARGVCDRHARAASSKNTAQDWREMANRFRLFGLRAGHVVLRELHFSHGLSP